MLSFLYFLITLYARINFVCSISFLNMSKYEENAWINAKNISLQNLDPPQKPLLCVTFMSLRSDKSWNNLLQNVKYAKERCEWLAVSYNSVDEKLLSSRIAVMNDVARWANTTASIQRHSFGDRDGLMKPLLFDTLLPRLRWYSKVWLMDEDISIVGFKFLSYFGIWNCAFDKASPPPVISQPLINGNKYSPPFDKDGWAMYKNAVVAIQSAWIEQQSPILDARFFAWFIENFVFPMKSYFIVSRSDFGYDQTWCGAARLWNHVIRETAPQVYRSDDVYNNPPCVVIMADNHVNHHDFKTITDWHAKKGEWLNRSVPLIHAFRRNFPHIFYDGFHDRAFYDKQRWFSKQSGTCKHKSFMHIIPDFIVETPQIRKDFLAYTYPFMADKPLNSPRPANTTRYYSPSDAGIHRPSRNNIYKRVSIDNSNNVNHSSDNTRSNRDSKPLMVWLTGIMPTNSTVTPTVSSSAPTALPTVSPSSSEYLEYEPSHTPSMLSAPRAGEQFE